MDAGGADGAGTVRRRPRFDPDADMKLVLAIRKREPYAAEHGMKLKVWDDVAEEVNANVPALQDMPLSRRAVMDRFQSLVQLCESGALQTKRWLDADGSLERASIIETLLKDITKRMTEIRSTKSKASAAPDQCERTFSPLSPPSGVAIASLCADEATASHANLKRPKPSSGQASTTDTTPANGLLTTLPSPSAAPSAAITPDPSASSIAHPELVSITPDDHAASDAGLVEVQTTPTRGPPQQPPSPTTAMTITPDAPIFVPSASAWTEFLALKREKLALKRRKIEILERQQREAAFLALEREKLDIKRRKLDLLECQHRERMDLERQRLKLLEQQHTSLQHAGHAQDRSA